MITKPELNKGERYIGATVSAEGVMTHIILLPGDKSLTHQKAMEWAAKIGGDLPTRVEQAMLYATAPDEFKKDAYWSNTLHASYSDCAWYQSFDYGSQGYSNTNFKLRARAVRRLIIQ